MIISMMLILNIACVVYRADPASGDFSKYNLRPLDLASAGVLRIFGTKVAELPLAVTYKGYRGKVRQACNSHSIIFGSHSLSFRCG